MAPLLPPSTEATSGLASVATRRVATLFRARVAVARRHCATSRRCPRPSAALFRWRLHWRTRLVEPAPTQRLQGDVRRVQGRTSGGTSHRGAGWLRGCRWPSARSPGRRRARSPRCPARGRRRRQRRLARTCGRPPRVMRQRTACPGRDAALRDPSHAARIPQRDDDLAAGRGVVYGALIGAVFWILLLGTILWFR